MHPVRNRPAVVRTITKFAQRAFPYALVGLQSAGWTPGNNGGLIALLRCAPSGWGPLACGNQIPQTAGDIEVPCVRALVEALELRNQPLVSEANFRFVAMP